ncbi:MAG TPA: purine-nucleoside phosphorylase [Luteibaculaceae bacterium]|nr:purine-nucleoside phosphorylase [Luteibaculaceae bacterium]
MNKLNEAVEFLRAKGITAPEVGIVLGTGLGNLATHIEVDRALPYHEIPHFPLSTVEFHKGQLIYGKLAGKQVVAMQGRFHFYEGYSMEQIVFPVRVMKLLGIQQLLLSNAAGCMNLSWKKGDLMLINDHINMQPSNPLIGNPYPELGPMFPDMSEPYSKKLGALALSIAKDRGIALNSGVYVSVPGPMLETRAEYRYLRNIGADAVGMSTVPEVIAANHMGLPCLAVSVLTDECDPDNLKPVDIADIIATAGKAELKLSELFIELLKKL